MIPYLKRFYDLPEQWMKHAQPVLLLAIRGYWGYQFFLAGRGKLMNLERTAAFFEQLAIPMPMMNAMMAGATECIGGLLLLLGLGSRMAAMPLTFTMFVAYATAHRSELGALFTNPETFVSAAPFPFLLASLIVLCFGPGWLSLDGVIQHFVLKRCPTGCEKQDMACSVSTATPMA